MEALAGPVVVLAALLALAGGLKVVRPVPTAGALRALHLPSSLVAVRLLGVGELVIGSAALVTFSPPVLLLVAAAYLAFATFVMAALGADAPLQSCGCFGRADTPPSAIHVALNLVAAGTAVVAAVTGTPALDETLSDRWNAVPFVVLVAVCVYLCVLLLTVLPLTSRRSIAP